MTGIGKPVELLRDGRGIYGIGVSDEFDIEALAWACGIDDLHLYPLRPSNLILRSDLLGDNKQKHRPSAVLQRITGGFRHGMFANFCEEHLRRVIHHEALNRAGLPWPPKSAWRAICALLVGRQEATGPQQADLPRLTARVAPHHQQANRPSASRQASSTSWSRMEGCPDL